MMFFSIALHDEIVSDEKKTAFPRPWASEWDFVHDAAF